MKKILVIGGSRGIGQQIINELIKDNLIINFSFFNNLLIFSIPLKRVKIYKFNDG